MKYTFAVVILLLYGGLAAGQHRVTIFVRAPGHTIKDSCFIAGNFNGWNPAAAAYRLLPHKDAVNPGTVSFTVPKAGLYEYKITRGNWAKVECDMNGRDIENRLLHVQSDTSISITVLAWKDQFAGIKPASTASKNVGVMDTAFLIKQLGRTRTVRVYLPPGYAGSRTRYPVLYMHDGQNLFDEALNPFGEWGVDEYLDSAWLNVRGGQARRACIIIGIDHGVNKRLTEYNPYNSVQFGKGEGMAYSRFLVETLKPVIDRKYRTLKDRAHTWIAGSSMGGLISWYAALKYPHVFGKAGVFSPAFWITGKQAGDELKKTAPRQGQAYYFYAGQQESESMVKDMMGIFGAMQQKWPAVKYKVSIKGEGRHNEAAWRNELPAFFEWLFR